MDELDSLDAFESQSGSAKVLPNSTAVLVLGILSLVTCVFYGVIGIILSIIALILAKKDMELYKTNPAAYAISFKNLKAGRVCAIIGLILSSIFFLVILGVFLTAMSNFGNLY